MLRDGAGPDRGGCAHNTPSEGYHFGLNFTSDAIEVVIFLLLIFARRNVALRSSCRCVTHDEIEVVVVVVYVAGIHISQSQRRVARDERSRCVARSGGLPLKSYESSPPPCCFGTGRYYDRHGVAR